jgi:hypothetical protein
MGMKLGLPHTGHRLNVFVNRVLRKIFGPEREGATEGWGICKLKSFINCILHPIS